MNKQKRERCREAMFQFYTKESLYRLYKAYLLDWIADGKIGKELDVFAVSLIGPKTEKEKFLELLEEFYLQKDLFLELYASLDEEVQKIFESLVWENRYYLDQTQRERYFSEENRFLKELNGKYSFFKLAKDLKNREYFYLEHDIIRQIRSYLPIPEDVHLRHVEKARYSWKSNNEKEILDNIEKYFDFYEQGGLSLSSSGKILKESKLNMKKYCSITEYYQDAKDLDYLKTETLALFFFLVKEEFRTKEQFQSKYIKEIVQKLFSTELVKEDNYIYSSLFLNFLKGVKNIWQHKEHLQECIQSLLEVLEELQVGMIVSVEQIIKSLLFQDKYYELIDVQAVKDYIYINEANYERTRITNYEKYRDYIVCPFVKSFLFLLGTLGLLEVYYDLPEDNGSLYLKNGYLSKYDGLKYIRFTDLGAYVFGRRENYEFKRQEEESEILLEEEHFIVTLLGNAPTKTMFLERIGQKIANNKYKISKESFLRGLEGPSSLHERIEEFHSKIQNPKPKIWKEFLEEIERKSDSIIYKPEYRVFQLKDDKELISILTKDSRFQNYVRKGEEYHIFIKEEHFALFAKYLKEYGYYVNC